MCYLFLKDVVLVNLIDHSESAIGWHPGLWELGRNSSEVTDTAALFE